jgi:nucleotide-binding universal stress UspA family protein
MKKICVGTDGSENAMNAMRWAVEEAGVHDAAVEVVLVWSGLDQYYPDRADKFDPHYSEDDAHAALAAWVAEAVDDAESIILTTVCDLPAHALLEAGDASDLLVIGARGKGGFEELLLGSVSDKVAQLAAGPVAVVHAPARVSGGRVVVGVDGSTRAAAALKWAAAEALARDADLDVVHAWRIPPSASRTEWVYPELSVLEDDARTTLDTAISNPALKDVRAHAHLAYDGAASAILARAEDAALIVAGTRGLGRIAGSLLGSVSRQLVHHAHCPVVIV